MESLETLYHQYFVLSNGVSTDTRSLKQGQIFFALRGPNFNGNKYVDIALESGASLCVIDDPNFKRAQKTYFVEDVLSCLQDLANYHRNRFDIPVLAITGSNGKTTTKELIASVISKKYQCQYTKGNLNNHIGVPLTLLSLKADCEFAIIEMGANHPGEIKMLADIANPNFGIITNIGKAHLEGFGDLEGVLNAKSELYEALRSKDGEIFINQNNDKLNSKIKKTDSCNYYNPKNFKKIKNEDDKIKVQYINETIETHLVGDYNIENIAAAWSIGHYFKVATTDIIEALETYHPDMNRSQKITKDGHAFILDAYNANPTSMQESIKSFTKNHSKNKVLILGEMLELGIKSQEEHSALLASLDLEKYKHICLIGAQFKFIKNNNSFLWFEDVSQLNQWYEEIYLDGEYSFLIKGSRKNRLELFNDLTNNI